MSDVKGVESKPASAEAAAGKPPEPAPTAPPPAAPKPEAAPAKVEHAKPAAPAAAPAPAPVAAAAAGPAPGTVGVRAPAAKTADQNLQITISAKAIAYVMTALVMVVLILGATTIFLLVRLTDPAPMSRVDDQIPGMEGKGYPPKAKGAAPAPETGGGVAEAKPEAPAAPEGSYESIEIGVNFKDGLGGKPSSLPGSWPAFRGPNLDFTAKGVSLANKWPKGGPPVKWKITGLGEGYSGAAVHAGRVYLQDYDGGTKEESLRCFSLDDGKEIWKRSYVMPIGNSHGFTRTVPAVTDKHAVVFGSMCHVMCVDAQSGALKWTINLMKEYGTQSMFSLWYASQCPIIDGDTVVLAPCGKDVLMMGVDIETGKVLWKTPNPKKYNLAHSSITPMTLNGKKSYVYCAEFANIVGVSAEKGSEGTLLWEMEWVPAKQVMSPSPVILDDGHIFMTAGVGAGSVLIKVTEQGGKYDAKAVWTLPEKDTLACEQQSAIYYEKHLFALQPLSGGGRKEQLVCMNPFNNGKVVWDSGNQKKFGYYEPTLLADGKIYVVGKDGSLAMVKATTDKYEELGRCKLLDGKEPWAPIALAGNLMIYRDSKTMICIDVGKGIE